MRRLSIHDPTSVPLTTASLTDLFKHLQGGLTDRYRLERELGGAAWLPYFWPTIYGTTVRSR